MRRLNLVDKADRKSAAVKRIVKQQETLSKRLRAAKKREKDLIDERVEEGELFSNL